ncbi:MAG TPA: zinc metallopeptidase [Anaerolineae bacterium]|jgi:Zn-dependent membrane protease YugP|nr:zinc metallopeptidase [Anaerolineae bacterium]
MFPFYFDIRYLLFSLPALVLALFAQWRVQSAYRKYSRIRNMRSISGLDAAQMLLRSNGLGNVGVQGTRGFLSDHYDPSKEVLRLSAEVARNPSIAALGIVAHEVGHALQHQSDYAPLRVRSGLVPLVNLGTWLGMILFVVGLVIEFSGLIWLGVIFFSGSVVFALVTVPVERDASRRALQILKADGLVGTTDIQGVQAVLSAAALTYVAALAQALSQLLYFVLLATGMSRRD